MTTFYVAHLPPESRSLKLINFSQSTGIKYSISSDPERLDEFMTANGRSSSSAERRNIFQGYQPEAADRSLFDREPSRNIFDNIKPLPAVSAAVLLVGTSSTRSNGRGIALTSGGTAVEREMTNRTLNPVQVVEVSDSDESVIVLDGDDEENADDVAKETGRQRLSRILEEEFENKNKKLPQHGIQKEMSKKDEKPAGKKVADSRAPPASREDEHHGRAVRPSALHHGNSQILMDYTEEQPAAQRGHRRGYIDDSTDEDSSEEDLGPVKRRTYIRAAVKRRQIISSDEEGKKDSGVPKITPLRQFLIDTLVSTDPEADNEELSRPNVRLWDRRKLSIDGKKTKAEELATIAAPIKKNFSCEVCERTFPSLEKVVAHIRVTRQKGRCCECKTRFTNILEHIRRHGVRPEKKDSSKETRSTRRMSAVTETARNTPSNAGIARRRARV